MKTRALMIMLASLTMMGCDATDPAAATGDWVKSPVSARPEAAPSRLRHQPVYTVDAITFEIRESHPVQLVIKARGTVRTGGWSAAELRPLQTFAPEQGMMSFTLVALPPPPGAFVTQALAPITAQITIPALDPSIKTIRILSETNELSQPLP